MFTSSLFLLASLACLGASLPTHSAVDPQWMLLRERRAVGGAVMAGSFYSSPLRKQECENCNQLTEEHVDEGVARTYEEPLPEEVPSLIDEAKPEEAPQSKAKTPKASKAIPSEEDDDEVPAPRPRKGGSKRSGSVYKNFFPMTFGARVVREVEAANEGDADVQANAKAEPDNEDEEEDEDDDDDFSPRSGGGSIYKDFFPMTFGVHSRYVREAEALEGGRGVGGVISIANSFSKGRGAVATSSATAYGTPSSNGNGNGNPNGNNQIRGVPPAEE